MCTFGDKLSAQGPDGQKYARLGFCSKFHENKSFVVVVMPLCNSEEKMLQHNVRKARLNVLSCMIYSA